MQIIPVIDLKGGLVVRAVVGDRQNYRPVRSVLAPDPRPLTVAAAFREAGFDTVYVADLDAIAGAAPNWSALQQIAARGLNLLLDAGVASVGQACQLARYADDQPRLAAIVLGLESVVRIESLADCLSAVGPNRSVFSLDLRRGRPVTRCAEWRHWSARQVAAQAAGLGFDRLILLDLARVGAGRGPGVLRLCRDLRGAHPGLQLIAGGGIRHHQDLRRLQQAGCTAALIASALHDGTLTPAELLAPTCAPRSTA